MEKTFVIAEAGVNHNGSLDLALKLIDAAVAAGADAVKFQTFIPEQVIAAHAPKAKYQQQLTGEEESQLDMVRKLYLPFDNFVTLKEHAEANNIEFMTTAFDPESLEFLKSLGLKRIKIPSGEITNLPYLRNIASFHLPVLLSTGMCTMDEIDTAINILEKYGTPKSEITVLHCNTEYPTPLLDVNLLAMLSIKDQLKVKVGYSDHTLGIDVAVVAVAMGARVIEKHFTLDKHLSGPDHQASLEPNEMKALVEAIRRTELILGTGIKSPSASEQKNISIARKSIVAGKKIYAGEIFSEENLAVKRPGTGISPMQWDEVIGLSAQRDYECDELIDP